MKIEKKFQPFTVLVNNLGFNKSNTYCLKKISVKLLLFGYNAPYEVFNRKNEIIVELNDEN
jgi:hypothetical protein